MNKIVFCGILFLSIICCKKTCFASDLLNQEYESLMDELLGDGSFDDVLNEVLKNNKVSTRQIIKELISGESTVFDVVKSLLSSGTFGFAKYKELLIKLLGISICCALFGFLPQVFDSDQASLIGHYISFIMLVTFLLTLFNDGISIVYDSINIIIHLMNIMIPVYLAAIALSGGVSTAGISYEIFVGIIYIIQSIIQKYLSSAITIYVVLGFVNQLLDNDNFSKLANLFRKIISRGLKVILGFLTGVQLLQGLISPYVDKLKTSFAGKVIDAIPGIGDVTASGLELGMGVALIIKNTIGVVIMIVLIVVGLTPVIELLAYASVLIFANIMLQPVLQVKAQKILDISINAMKLLIQTLLTVMLMFLVSIAILAIKAGGGI